MRPILEGIPLKYQICERILYFAAYVVINPGSVPNVKKGDAINEKQYDDIKEYYYNDEEFKVGMGAEAIKELLSEIDIDALDAELYNKGLGGAPFCPHLVKAENGVDNPDYITVAYGTNDWSHCEAETIKANCDGFLKELHQKYPGVPMFVLSPIWRADIDTPKKAGTYADVEKIIEDASKKYKNMTLVHGLELVPPDSRLFGDIRLHPNDHGFMCYAEGLKKYFID